MYEILQSIAMALIIGSGPKLMQWLLSLFSFDAWYDVQRWWRGTQVLELRAEETMMGKDRARTHSRNYFNTTEQISNIEAYLQQHSTTANRWAIQRKGKLRPIGTMQVGDLRVRFSESINRSERAVTHLITARLEAPSRERIEQFLKECSAYVTASKEAEHVQSYYCQELNGDEPDWLAFDLTIRTTWDSVFYREKERLRRDVDALTARGSGKIVALLHGPPGTGKTSTIRAIAQATGRSIINVDLTLTKNNQQLAAIFHGQQLGEHLMPLRKHRIYVFEEIDTQLEALDKRRAALDTVDPADMSRNPQVLQKYLKQRDENRLTIGGLLTTLDGIIELDNVIVIMTTNHVERLDPRLIRPGRVTHNIKLGALEPADAEAMMCAKYGAASAAQRSLQPPLPQLPGEWLPSELEELMSRCDTVDTLREAIKHRGPSS
jgi:hypothetical protein